MPVPPPPARQPAPRQPALLQPRAIDLHAHFLPARYRASALAHGQAHPDGMPALPEWDAADAVAMMDDVGIAAAALSLSSPGVSFLDSPAARARLTRAVNEDGTPLPRALPALLSLVEASQIVYGSDYPFTPAAPVRAFAEVIAATGALDPAARAAALRGNALRLLPRLARAQEQAQERAQEPSRPAPATR